MSTQLEYDIKNFEMPVKQKSYNSNNHENKLWQNITRLALYQSLYSSIFGEEKWLILDK